MLYVHKYAFFLKLIIKNTKYFASSIHVFIYPEISNIKKKPDTARKVRSVNIIARTFVNRTGQHF